MFPSAVDFRFPGSLEMQYVYITIYILCPLVTFRCSSRSPLFPKGEPGFFWGGWGGGCMLVGSLVAMVFHPFLIFLLEEFEPSTSEDPWQGQMGLVRVGWSRVVGKGKPSLQLFPLPPSLMNLLKKCYKLETGIHIWGRTVFLPP